MASSQPRVASQSQRPETQNPRVELNERRMYRDDKMFHLDTISKSIGRIVTHSKDGNFQADIGQMLNVKVGRRKKTIQIETMKLLKANYSNTNESQNNQ